MLQNSSNDVIGFSKLVEHRLDTSANNVRSWSGDVTADYVNHFGGVDRTNVHYAFGSGLGDLVCYPAPAASMGQ